MCTQWLDYGSFNKICPVLLLTDIQMKWQTNKQKHNSLFSAVGYDGEDMQKIKQSTTVDAYKESSKYNMNIKKKDPRS